MKKTPPVMTILEIRDILAGLGDGKNVSIGNFHFLTDYPLDTSPNRFLNQIFKILLLSDNQDWSFTPDQTQSIHHFAGRDYPLKLREELFQLGLLRQPNERLTITKGLVRLLIEAIHQKYPEITVIDSDGLLSIPPLS